jgi:CHAT domain-containing protein/tetratricopeptide (TPR) repeat protein
MLPTRILRFKSEELLSILWMCFCIAALLATSHVQETAALPEKSEIDVGSGQYHTAVAGGSTSGLQINSNIACLSLSHPLPRCGTDPIQVRLLSFPDAKDGEAQQALARAEALRAQWTEAALRQAIEDYDNAALLWTSISDFANASEATRKSGDVYFLFSEYKKALERYQNAEVLAKRSSDWLAQARTLSQIGRVQSYLGNNDLAQKQLTRALHLFEQHEANRSVIATNAYGEALSNEAEVTYATGNFAKAWTQFDGVLNVLQSDPNTEAKVHLFKAYIAGSRGDRERAVEEISLAQRLYEAAGNKRGEGLALTAKGMSLSLKTTQHLAIELHSKAIKIFRAIGDRHSEAVALNAIGQVYENVEDYRNAGSHYKLALELFENTGALDAAAGTMYSVAAAYRLGKDLDQALEYYERCLELSRTAGKLRHQAYALTEIAAIYGTQGLYEPALKHYQELPKFFKSIGDLRGLAITFNGHGDVLLKMGEKKKALDLYRQAFSLGEKMRDNGILLATLFNLARANLALGFHDTARTLIQQSFDLIEELRKNVGSPDFRASYFSGVRKHYDLYVEILMQLDRLRPGQGFAAEAFFVTEQGRARSLLELLSESRTRIRAGVGKELVEHEHSLRERLRARAQYQMNLALSGKETSEMAEVTADVAQLKSQYQVVQAQLREQNPQLFSFEQFVPVRLERIQNELDSDTMLLEFALGDEHSYLWAITSNSVEYYILPARREIEQAATEFYKLITALQGNSEQSNAGYQASVEAAERHYSEKAKNLSRILLGQVAEGLGNRRLVVVTEGALQYIPFSALPPPERTAGPVGTYLLETNEVVVLPSASTLIAIRGAQKGKASPGKVVAVIADPVFGESDERVQNDALSSATAKAAAAEDPNQPGHPMSEDSRLARLHHASKEADAIFAVAPWGTTLVAKGFDASRETVMSSEISRAQIVHFATHGILNTENPELSAIVLTMIDRNGSKTNGLMPLPDIYSLDLSAQLVVLSACQTALGKELNGEGLVGLTHSFMSAGANSVVASLWKVDDRATAVLMAEFHKGMLQKGMTPSAALRSAQLKMMHDKQWSAPYYWAGFVLQGEYANHIAVERRVWLRPGLLFLFLLILTAVTLLILHKRKRRIAPSQFN